MTERVETIDASCAAETLRRWLEAGVLREFKAPAVFRLSCGHLRPTNHRAAAGDELRCHICGPGPTIVALEMLDEPEWFPHPDALRDLPTPA